MLRHKQNAQNEKENINKHKVFKITSYQRNTNQNEKGISCIPIKLSKTILKIVIDYWQECKKWSLIYR